MHEPDLTEPRGSITDRIEPRAQLLSVRMRTIPADHLDLRTKRHIVTEDAKRRLTLHDATPQSVFGLKPDNEHGIPRIRRAVR